MGWDNWALLHVVILQQAEFLKTAQTCAKATWLMVGKGSQESRVPK